MVSDLFLRSFLIHSLGYTSDLCWEEYYNRAFIHSLSTCVSPSMSGRLREVLWEVQQ